MLVKIFAGARIEAKVAVAIEVDVERAVHKTLLSLSLDLDVPVWPILSLCGLLLLN